MASSTKHVRQQSTLETSDKRPKLDDTLLPIDKDFRDRSFGSLTTVELWEMLYDVKKLGFDNALARACLTTFHPESATLQQRYHNLSFIELEDAAKIIMKDDIARPKAKVCARAIRTFKAVQDACKMSKNHETYLEAVKLGAAYYSILFSIEGKKSEDHVPAAKDGFQALVEILEAQNHKTAHSKAEEAHTAASDLISDEYLRARVHQFQLVIDEKTVQWDQIRGQDHVKDSLEAMMETLLLRNEGQPEDEYPGQPAGLLLHGPQGCGKTSLAHSFAKEYKLPIFQLDSNVTGKLCDETIKTLTMLFSHLRTIGPCALLMDDVTGMLQSPDRGSGNATILLEMQAHLKMLWSQLMVSEMPVFVIATTSRPWTLEMSDFTSRFGFVEYVTLPDAKARRDLWSQSIQRYYTIVSVTEIATIADRYPGYSADDMNRIVDKIIYNLRGNVLEVEGFNKATFQGEERLIPSSTGPFDVAKACQQLTVGERSDVLYAPLQADMIEECLKSGRVKSVSSIDVQRHEEWDRATMVQSLKGIKLRADRLAVLRRL